MASRLFSFPNPVNEVAARLVAVTEVAVSRLPIHPKRGPGPPKRFAQGIGATVSTAALVAWLTGALGLSDVLLGLLVVAATLESVFAICLGCKAFAVLMRVGVIPERVCVECADISARLGTPVPQ